MALPTEIPVNWGGTWAEGYKCWPKISRSSTFVYLDKDGNVLDDDTLGNVVARIDDIRSVQITIVARTGRVDREFTNSKVYKNLQGTTIFTAPGDHIRRRCLSRHVRCRNLGLI